MNASIPVSTSSSVPHSMPAPEQGDLLGRVVRPAIQRMFRAPDEYIKRLFEGSLCLSPAQGSSPFFSKKDLQQILSAHPFFYGTHDVNDPREPFFVGIPVVETEQSKSCSYLYIEANLQNLATSIPVLKHETFAEQDEPVNSAEINTRIKHFQDIVNRGHKKYSVVGNKHIGNNYALDMLLKYVFSKNECPAIAKKWRFSELLPRRDFPFRNGLASIVITQNVGEIASHELGQWGKVDETRMLYLILRLETSSQVKNLFLVLEGFCGVPQPQEAEGVCKIQFMKVNNYSELGRFEGYNLFSGLSSEEIRLAAAKKILNNEHPAIRLALSDSNNSEVRNLRFDGTLTAAKELLSRIEALAKELGLPKPIWPLDDRIVEAAKKKFIESDSSSREKEESKKLSK